MEGKFVRLQNPSLLSVFYPDYKVKESLSILGRGSKVIYVGPSFKGLKEYLQKFTTNFISLSGVAELDLTANEALLKWVFSKRGKEPSQKLLDSIEIYDQDYFEYCLKIYWQTGRWVGETTDSEGSLYELFQQTIGSVKDELSVYFKLYSSYPFPVIESSLLTFLQRVKTVDEQNVKPAYLRLLKSANLKYGSKISSSVLRYYQYKGLRNDLKFLNLLLDLR